MKPLPRGVLESPGGEADQLQVCAAYANTISRCVHRYADPEQRLDVFSELGAKVAAAATIADDDLFGALNEAAALTNQYVRMLKPSGPPSAGLERLFHLEEVPGAA